VLIEEYWPERFEQLRVDEMLMETWHRNAEHNVVPEGWDEEEWGAFSRVLRNSRRIRTNNLYPYLRLKMSDEEAQLEHADDYRRAVCEADFSWLNTHLAGADEGQLWRYSSMLRSIFDSMEAAGRTLEAVNVVHSGFAIPQLWREPAKRLLAHAIANAGVASRLITIGADSLVKAADDLESRERKNLLIRLSTALGDPALDVMQRTKIAEVLAQRADDLGSRAKQEIRRTARTMGPSDPLDIYAPLADVMPNEAGTAALAMLANQEDAPGSQTFGACMSVLARALAAGYAPSGPDLAGALEAVPTDELKEAPDASAAGLLAFIEEHRVPVPAKTASALKEAAAPVSD
jgi:hypothetical protein